MYKTKERGGSNNMSIGTIITIVLVAIFSIIAQKAKKVKKDDTTEHNPTPATPETWADVLRELGHPGQTQADIDQPQRVEPTVSQETIAPEIVATAPQAEAPKTEPEETPEIMASDPITDTEIGKLTEELTDPQMLRKAVVYSEILNRKYQ